MGRTGGGWRRAGALGSVENATRRVSSGSTAERAEAGPAAGGGRREARGWGALARSDLRSPSDPTKKKPRGHQSTSDGQADRDDPSWVCPLSAPTKTVSFAVLDTGLIFEPISEPVRQPRLALCCASTSASFPPLAPLLEWRSLDSTSRIFALLTAKPSRHQPPFKSVTPQAGNAK